MRAELEAAPLPRTLGEFVRARAADLGDATVGNWFEDGVRLSYRQLDELADRLASSLLALGVRKGTHVAVMLPNISAFPVTWIAIGRIGAVMVPVNTAYTGDEIHFVLADSDAQFCVIDAALLGAFGSMLSRPPLLVDANMIVHGEAAPEGMQHWSSLVAQGQAPFEAPSPVGENDLLNLQYTSGTTGFPKGCMLTHDYWMIIGANAARHRGSTGGVENILIWAPMFYMDPMWQFLMTMHLGGTAFIARRMSLTRFHDWLRAYSIHYCIYPEPALKQEPPSERDREIRLKFASIYGWREDARREIEERFGLVAREGYGMTEIGGGSFVPASSVKAYVRTCGLAAPFRELRIVDDAGQDVPVGEVGELWVAGRGILWGYYKRPEANASSFRGKWFRTGDLFRRDDAGYYFIVGRIKDMIKRGGENIAAIEVEAVLRSIPEVEEAAVVPVPDALRREEVKAYLKLREGLTREDLPPQQVIAHCQTKLAEFKVPRYLAYVQSDFPRTPSRKIAKRQLIAGVPDLRLDAYDRQDGIWR
jgi:acyl-CoA synthetase (AMP-forming)/AMP-acid ligase II